MLETPLWNRLKRFPFDETDADFPFSERLASEQGWTQEYAARVIEEYRRFLYLAIEAGHPVTPSREVDEAWHLHLCYTRSYWEGLCGEVLGRQLHHGPTRGGAKEDGKFEEWYERTLASYRSVFGQEPPADVWPTSRVRFGPNPWTKVNTQDCWVVRKSAVAWSAAAAIPLGLLVGCSGSGDQSLGIFVFGSIFLLVMLANLASGRRRRGRRFRSRRRKGSGCGSSGCGSSGCGSSNSGSSGCGSSGCGGGGGGD